MLITAGKIHDGAIEADVKDLPEGAMVTVLAHEGDEIFELDAAQEASLLAAIAEAERGEVIDASRVTSRIRTGPRPTRPESQCRPDSGPLR